MHLIFTHDGVMEGAGTGELIGNVGGQRVTGQFSGGSGGKPLNDLTRSLKEVLWCRTFGGKGPSNEEWIFDSDGGYRVEYEGKGLLVIRWYNGSEVRASFVEACGGEPGDWGRDVMRLLWEKTWNMY